MDFGHLLKEQCRLIYFNLVTGGQNSSELHGNCRVSVIVLQLSPFENLNSLPIRALLSIYHAICAKRS